MPAKVTLYFARTALDGINIDQRWFRLRLFKNNFTPTASSVLGDYTEADFDGYANYILPWNAAYINGDDVAQADAGSHTWVKDVGINENTVYGVFVTDSVGDEVTAYEKFPTPISMVVPGEDAIFYQFSPTAVGV